MLDRASLDALYVRYGRAECAVGDPVGFLHGIPDVREREVAGLIAAFLAFGRLEQILRSVADALGRLEGRPRQFLVGSATKNIRAACAGFGHRWVDDARFCRLLVAVKDVVRAYNSLEACFLAHDDGSAPTILPGLTGLARELAGAGAPSQIVADPRKGSACKRWNLYLRWMVRRDAVDPGGWQGVSPTRLVVPLDTHMWRVCRLSGFTERGTCDLGAALEVTDSFRRICPEDPVKYDFALMHASLEGRLGAEALAGAEADATDGSCS